MSGHKDFDVQFTRLLIHDRGGYTSEDSFLSFTQQDAVTDVLNPISFGVTKTSANGIVHWDDTEKTFTVLKGGSFGIKTRQRLTRVGASAGTSDVIILAQLSVDGGSSWLPIGNPIDEKIKDTQSTRTFFDFALANLPAGVKLRQVFARDSSGSDFGSLVPFTPSAALQSQGVGVIPSAQVTIYIQNDPDLYR